MSSLDRIRALITPLRTAMANFDCVSVQSALGEVMTEDAIVHLCHPFGDLSGPQALYDAAYVPLFDALSDLERRDWIVSADSTIDLYSYKRPSVRAARPLRGVRGVCVGPSGAGSFIFWGCFFVFRFRVVYFRGY